MSRKLDTTLVIPCWSFCKYKNDFAGYILRNLVCQKKKYYFYSIMIATYTPVILVRFELYKLEPFMSFHLQNHEYVSSPTQLFT